MTKIMTKKMTDEERWRAEDDARTIREYAKLKADAKRYKKAVEVIKAQKNELTKILKNKED